MSTPTIKAFVSSTYEDLKDHRAHVIKALGRSGIFVDPMENWTAASDEPKVFSQQRMQGCRFCVLLVAFRRGYVPSGETKSITQLEYEAALAHNVDVLPYLLKEGCGWPPAFNELDSDPEIRAWRSHIEANHGRELFDENPSSVDVAPAVSRWVMAHAHPVVAGMTGLADQLTSHRELLRERRNEVADYLRRTEGLIKHAHSELSEGREPYGTCQQIFDTVAQLVDTIGDAVPKDVPRLKELLEKAYAVEILHTALETEEERDLNLAALDRTRGSFAALVEAIGARPIDRPN